MRLGFHTEWELISHNFYLNLLLLAMFSQVLNPSEQITAKTEWKTDIYNQNGYTRAHQCSFNAGSMTMANDLTSPGLNLLSCKGE